jgi:hypothetical protein
MRKKFFYLVITFVYFISFSNHAYSANKKFAAAYLHMDYVDSNSSGMIYRVYLTLYEKCGTAGSGLFSGFNSTENICWFSQDCYVAYGFMKKDLKIKDTGYVSQYCVGTGASSCFDPSGTMPGYVYAIYSDTIVMPGPCDDWTVDWNPRTSDTYVDVFNSFNTFPINLSDVRILINNSPPYNKISSPKMTAQPNFYFCPNNHNTFFASPAPDSLYTTNFFVMNFRVSNGNCTSANLSPASYNVGFSSSTPFGPTLASDPWTIDPLTGAGTVTPTDTGNFLISVGSILVDSTDPSYPVICQNYFVAEINVSPRNCTVSSIPYIDYPPTNITGGLLNTVAGKKIITTCAKETLSFRVRGMQPAGSVYMTYDLTFAPGSAITVTGNGTDTAIANFSWTPTVADYGDHWVTIASNSGTCGKTDSILIRVNCTLNLPTIVGKPNVSIIPNPVGDHFTVNAAENGKLYLLDMQGRIIERFTINKGVNQFEFPGSQNAGIYIGKFIANDGNINFFRLTYTP